jgi:hypothetical protein
MGCFGVSSFIRKKLLRTFAAIEHDSENMEFPKPDDRSLATVTRDCIFIHDAQRGTKTMVSLESITGMRRIWTTHPVLLVFAAALMLIAFAAMCSKEGGGAHVPAFVAAALVGIGYWISRRVAVGFLTETDSIETAAGSPAEAAVVIEKVRSAQAGS